jgi:hypothetical protein
MRKIIYAVVALAAFSFNTAPGKQTPDMHGVYNMLSQSVNDGTRDSTLAGVKQLKIYTESFMMYANSHSPDSVASFGIGSYTTEGGKVIEHTIYSASDTSNSSEAANFTLDIEKTAKGYKQVIKDIAEIQGKKYSLAEEYESVGKKVKSPLDGAWKELKSFTLNGKDTTMNKVTQFKTYYGGYVIWGQTYMDSATQKSRTGIGCGTFEMTGNNKSKEIVTNSNYSQIVGMTFNIDIEFKGNDEYKQTITGSNGDKYVEIYQRLKK